MLKDGATLHQNTLLKVQELLFGALEVAITQRSSPVELVFTVDRNQIIEDIEGKITGSSKESISLAIDEYTSCNSSRVILMDSKCNHFLRGYKSLFIDTMTDRYQLSISVRAYKLYVYMKN